MKDMIGNIYNEDCMLTMSRMEDKSVNLIIADFPYYEVKGDFDFIWKDFDEFLEWVEVVAKEFKRVLSDNGSLYIYGHAKKIAYKQIIFDKYFNIENHIVWNKLDCQTKKGIKELRSYAPIKEHILFYSNEISQTGTEFIIEEYIAPKNPFSIIIKEQMKLKNIAQIELSRLQLSRTNNLTGWVSNKISGVQCPTKEQWGLLCNRFEIENNFEYLKKEYEYLKKEYEYLKKEYEYLRRPFNNTIFTDILEFSQQANITGKYNHPTQKPPKLSRALIETSTNEDSIVYIPFGGSGVELEQCEILGLDWIGSELEKKYCDIIEDRIKNAKGEVGLFAPTQASLF